MAAESSRMKDQEPSPPVWAEALLRAIVKPSDRESIPGDLLEEYRAVKHPRFGALRANTWYVKQVLSVLLVMIWPSVLARTAVVARTGLFWIGIALLVVIGLLGPGVAPLAQLAHWRVVGGPPLDFDAPHNGQVIAHIDVLGRFPPDISRIRVTNTADGTVVWDVRPLSNRSECWNRCWNLKFQVGPNQSSFTAGPQVFVAQVPRAPTFSLAKGTPYLFEAWDGKGRVQSERFQL